MKKLCLVLVILVVSVSVAQARARSRGGSSAVDKGSIWLTGAASFSSSGGDLYTGGDGEGGDGEVGRLTTIALDATANVFHINRFFVGYGLGVLYMSQSGSSGSAFSIGADIGHAFGGRKSAAYPFVSAGYRVRFVKETYTYVDEDGAYEEEEKYNAGVIIGKAGVVVPLRDHLGLSIAASYEYEDENRDEAIFPVSGNTIRLAFGIVGLVY